MRIAVFGPEHRVGAVEKDRVVDLTEACRGYSAAHANGDLAWNVQGDPSALTAFIDGGTKALDQATSALDWVRSASFGDVGPTGQPLGYLLRDVKLHAPWAGRRVACSGGNYGDHLASMMNFVDENGNPDVAKAEKNARATGQWGFWKIANETAGPGDDIPQPRRANLFDYEAEIGIVLGETCKNVKTGDVRKKVWGYTLVNDWSIRNDMGTPRPMSYNQPKNFDRCASMGPVVVVGEGDYDNIDVELRVNGELRQSFNTRSMIFSFDEIVENLSRDLTLLPGDVIAGGTAAGTAADTTKRNADGIWEDTTRFLKIGDVVQLSSPQVGTLINQIVAP
jgi:2-keto-4-pentenoate hydratase/2-oxohepta-3-ene-1,7-dioic acid hydratase in catechol pathway